MLDETLRELTNPQFPFSFEKPYSINYCIIKVTQQVREKNENKNAS